MIGRKTNGGLEMTSKPFSVPLIGVGLAPAVAEAVGEGESDGVGSAEGDADGEGAAATSVKLAHGLGGTLAQSLWPPGLSLAKGFTVVTKLPLLSALAPPATWSGVSQ